MQKLINLKAKIAAARAERGATDPILVIAAIAVSLVLLVGGSFAVSGIITNGQNLNAKGDLDKVSVAEVANFAESDSYASYAIDGGVETGDAVNAAGDLLTDAGIGFTPTEGDDIQLEVIASDNGWIAKSVSASGATYFKSSESNAIVDTFAELELPADQATATEAGFLVATTTD